VVAPLADDPAGADVLAGQRGQQRALERCRLVRSARAMVAGIPALLPEPAATPTTWPSNGWKPTTATRRWSAEVAR
jgi:hypothetical protein